MNKKVLLVDQIAKINYKYTFSLAECLLKQGIDVHLVLDLKKNEEVNCPSDNIFITDEKDVSKFKKVLNLFLEFQLSTQIPDQNSMKNYQ